MFGKKKLEKSERVYETLINVTFNGIMSKQDEPMRLNNRCYYNGAYYIEIYNMYDGEWHDICYHVQEILGVEKYEFLRICREIFNAKTYISSHMVDVYWHDREDAVKAMEAFRPYYDSFYIPRVIINRLENYEEGGFLPHFIKHKKPQGQRFSLLK